MQTSVFSNYCLVVETAPKGVPCICVEGFGQIQRNVVRFAGARRYMFGHETAIQKNEMNKMTTG